jgi:hypothetical protein
VIDVIGLDENQIAEICKKNLNVFSDLENCGLVMAAYASQDSHPQFARNFANGIKAVVSTYVFETVSQAIAENNKLIEKRLEELKTSL